MIEIFLFCFYCAEILELPKFFKHHTHLLNIFTRSQTGNCFLVRLSNSQVRQL